MREDFAYLINSFLDDLTLKAETETGFPSAMSLQITKNLSLSIIGF
nr:MAG TPA: hypothetical protein [Caudoviricetes sp.]